MYEASVRGVRLRYDITGDEGPLVVQLHGLTSSRSRDAQLGLDLGRALRDHRVLRFDARAHGGSSGTDREDDYRWEALARDLLALLDEVAPGETVHAIGPSMGTGTLLHAAVRRPQLFRSLTLVTPPTAWKTRRMQADLYRANAEIVARSGMSALLEMGHTAPVPPALAYAPATTPTVPADLLPTVLRGAAGTDLPKKKKIRRIEAPTLILAWTDDATHPLKTARALDELLPHSRLVIARSAYGIMAWPGLVAEHVALSG